MGAGALGVTAKTAEAGIVHTVFSPPSNTVGFSAGFSFTVSQVATAGGSGGFRLFTKYDYFPHSLANGYSVSTFFRIALAGLNGLNFQDAPGPGFMWNGTAPVWSSKVLRSKRSFFKYTYTTHKRYPASYSSLTKTVTDYNPHITPPTSSILLDRTGDFFLLFQFNPTGSQTLYGWLHLFGDCNCGLDTTAVDLAYDDSGALIAAGQTETATPEPATMIPTGLAALALGSTGIRRWRKARKQAA